MTELLGKTIGEYQLVELIIDMPTTVVLKAFQPGLNRNVALEVLKPSASRDAAASQRFLQFGEIASRLQHPNLMPVYDSGREGSVVYRVMPLMPGGRLSDQLASYRDPNMALELVKQIEAALSYLHTKGYIHGHLTPENILFDESRRVVLSGYGFPQPLGGTPTPYLSPEQVQGGAVDQRTDIYALGVLLYTMLAGQAPPPGVVVNLRAVRPDLPKELEMLILKALAQNPDQRYQTASEFRIAFDAALRPVVPSPSPAPQAQAAPTPASAMPQPPQKRTNWATILMGGVLIILLCLCVVLVAPQVMDYFATSTPAAEVQPPEPTEPQPGITVVAPTREPRPTRTAAEIPTEPPEPEPTQPPEQPPEQLPELTEQPPGEGDPNLPNICGSAGFIGGSVIFGFISVSRRRRKHG